jgi:hypothetical protein
MNTPESNDKPPEPPPESVAGASPETSPTPPESIKPEPQPLDPVRLRPIGGPAREMSVPTMVAVILCALLPLLPAGFMSDANSYWVCVLPIVFGLIAIGSIAAANGGPSAGRGQAITVAIVILIPLALFVYLFVECSNTLFQ